MCKTAYSFSDTCLKVNHDQEGVETVLQQSRSEKGLTGICFFCEYSAPYGYSDLCGMALLKKLVNGERFVLPSERNYRDVIRQKPI